MGHYTIQALLPLLPSIISLNLSNCNIGNKGAVDLANNIPSPETIEEGQGLRVLDISNNEIEISGFLQLLNRFKTS